MIRISIKNVGCSKCGNYDGWKLKEQYRSDRDRVEVKCEVCGYTWDRLPADYKPEKTKRSGFPIPAMFNRKKAGE